MIDAFASEPHYADHIRPIWDALPERGTWVTDNRAFTRTTMVASYRDLWMVSNRLPGVRHVLVEHGAGQTYGRSNPSYSGGRDRGSVGLFICPNRAVADRNRAAYPHAEAVAVGAPSLDAQHRHPASVGGAVAISFHWDCTLVPESRSAFRHYKPVLRHLARTYPDLIGHAHPRAFRALAPIYEAAGITPVQRWSDVLDQAGVYVCDNSSTLYEFASTGRPVVVLNAPWYRRGVEHGLRFWSEADVGLQVDDPVDLPDAIERARADPPPIRRRREEIVEQVYGVTDGKAAQRAAAAITAWEGAA